MNQIEITLAGKQYSLLFNGYAMFAEQELFGETGMIEEIQQNTAKGFEALCKAVCLLAEQGELARRYEGHEAQEMLSVDQVRVLATPIDMLMLRTAVVRAVMKGYGREIEETEKDLGLAELEKKTTSD